MPDSLHARRVMRGVRDAADRMAQEHPLDTLLREMLGHGWEESDPMIRWTQQAMKIPYPMTRTEAVEQGIVELEELR